MWIIYSKIWTLTEVYDYTILLIMNTIQSYTWPAYVVQNICKSLCVTKQAITNHFLFGLMIDFHCIKIQDFKKLSLDKQVINRI